MSLRMLGVEARSAGERVAREDAPVYPQKGARGAVQHGGTSVPDAVRSVAEGAWKTHEAAMVRSSSRRWASKHLDTGMPSRRRTAPLRGAAALSAAPRGKATGPQPVCRSCLGNRTWRDDDEPREGWGLNVYLFQILPKATLMVIES